MYTVSRYLTMYTVSRYLNPKSPLNWGNTNTHKEENFYFRLE